MKILYAIDETAEVEPVACLVTRLAQHGDVHVIVDATDADTETRLQARCAGSLRVRCSPAPPVSPQPMSYLAERLMRALEPPARPRLAPALRWCERLLPTAPGADAFLEAERPDVLLTPPLAEFGSLRADLIRSARAAGIPQVMHGELTGDFADRIVSAVERSGSSVRVGRPPAPAVGARLTRPVLMRLAARVAATPEALRARETRVARLRRSRENAAAARRTGLISARQTAAGDRARLRQERAAHRDARRLERAAEQAAAEASRAAALAVSREQFEQARAWASRMRTQGAVELSDVERRLADDLAPLWSLGPDAVATLRHWSAVITGDRPEQYRDGEANQAEAGVTSWHREFYGRQKELGPALMVSDADVLGGGFGWIRNEIRYNADTLRYMHAAGALSDGAVLPAFRGARTRQVVWEIGGGWGGFAHYFKTLCPNVTYLITGLPETLLVTATFLQAAFPDARCRFYEPGSDPWAGAGDADFVFAPESALDDLRPPRLDLTLDLGGLPQMTAERLSAHVRRAFDWGSRFVYSMLPPGTLAGGDAAVRAQIERYFWPHPVAPRPVSHDAKLRGEGVPRYTHLVGWRRICV